MHGCEPRGKVVLTGSSRFQQVAKQRGMTLELRIATQAARGENRAQVVQGDREFVIHNDEVEVGDTFDLDA